MQEITEINAKPSARYAQALFSLCQTSKTITEMEEHVVNLLEMLKSDNGLNAFLETQPLPRAIRKMCLNM